MALPLIALIAALPALASEMRSYPHAQPHTPPPAFSHTIPDPPPPAYMPTVTYFFRSRDPGAPSTPYVLNASAVDAHGSRQAAYRVQTDRRARATTLVRVADGVRLAKFEWKDVPTVKLEGGRVECRAWAPLLEDKSTRRITHEDQTYLLSHRRGVYTLKTESETQRSRTIAVWRTKDRYLQLEAFPDASLTPGLLDVCFIALTMIECRKDLGDAVVDAEESIGQVAKKSKLESLANAFH
ncbi:hypothetical protein PsYK624_130010 [Phanerochaete sordida]|uniref:Uncharacterized protein n=1 Tax=Phanerochaete sordida TaxID=48140 RepID=A0A9P3GNR2_9APHY|nr:hypothetical protein PsYK624_130010 [Phanerochaete sordida]